MTVATADFKNSRVNSADFEGASLLNVRYLTPAQVCQEKSLRKIIVDAALNQQIEARCLIF